MDADIWHRYCVEKPPAEPDALTVKQFRTLSDVDLAHHVDQLKAWLGHFYIQTAELSAVEERMTNLVANNSRAFIGAKDVLVLTGENTRGKSTLTQMWAKKNYLNWIAGHPLDDRGRPVFYPQPGIEADYCPVVWCNVPFEGSYQSVVPTFDAGVLHFLGLPAVGSLRTQTKSVISALKRHRVRVLVVDDTNIMKMTPKAARAILDHIKNINTELGEIGGSMILIGADAEQGELVKDPQLQGRMRLARYPEYNADTHEEMAVYQTVVQGIEERLLPLLPRGKPGMLCAALPGHIWSKTQGFLGDLRNLVRDAAVAATLDRSHVIQLKHLAKVDLSLRAQLCSAAPKSRRTSRA